jgi:hypothetical protein
MLTTKKVTFILPAEIVAGATEGLLLGEFNNWDKENGFSLRKYKDGSMKATVELEAGKTYEYRYLLDGGRWVNDASASGYNPVLGLGVENCVVEVVEEANVTEAGTETPKKPAKAAKKVEAPAPAPAKAKAKAAPKKSAAKKK